LADLVPPGTSVSVEAEEEILDPFDRVLLYVYDAGGDMVNRAMVRAGHAEAVLYEPNDRHIERMRAAEAAARDAGRGLWSAC
ncbi:thermonuclease family protein, partial [Nocardioides sp. SOB44]